ncbi:S8 family peptidase [Clostridium sp. B9]|uniref:S8 family peptidase n=1 Tax=Clostridium sp. B9 TaxID=3423224 RepID=UPI003D2EC3BF
MENDSKNLEPTIGESQNEVKDNDGNKFNSIDSNQILDKENTSETKVDVKDFLLTDPDTMNFLVEYTGDIKSEVKDLKNVDVYIIDDTYAVLSMKDVDYDKTIQDIKGLVFIELGGIYTLSTTSPLEASKAQTFHKSSYLQLTGKDVIVGIIDTGIDYLNEEFMTKDGKTRILKIWDQGIRSDRYPKNMFYGTEYNQNEIDAAIDLSRRGGDPYTIVPSKDEVGHGTEMSCIIAGSGKDEQLAGVVPESDIVVVKLDQAFKKYIDYFFVQGDTPKYRNVDILLAMKYLYGLSFEYKKPVVIYVPVGSNFGAHDGTSILERYIDEISNKRGIAVVASSGNQGNTDTHTDGVILETGLNKTIELEVGKDQKGLMMIILGYKPDKFRLSIISPSGEIIENANPIPNYGGKKKLSIENGYKITFVYEGTVMDIFYDSPDELTGGERIVIRAKNLKPGIWRFKLTGEYIVYGKFDAFILQRELLAKGTKFLTPSPYTTLTIPGAAEKMITVAFYDQDSNTIVSESGRGYSRNRLIQPMIAAGGVNAVTVNQKGEKVSVTGGSVAAAVVSGCCAMLFQWGIVYNNDPTLYVSKLQTYLMRGADTREGDVYPNQEWGYGTINMIKVFDSLKANKLFINTAVNPFSE